MAEETPDNTKLAPLEVVQGSPSVTVILEDGYSLDEHFKWLLDHLPGIEKSKNKRQNREAVGKKIELLHWIRGPPTVYYANFPRHPEPYQGPFVWREFGNDDEYRLVRSAPGVAKVIKQAEAVEHTFMCARRSPILALWNCSGRWEDCWTITFKSDTYTLGEHFAKIGTTLPICARMRRQYPGPRLLKECAGYYMTDDGVTEEQILVVLTDPNVYNVTQHGGSLHEDY